MKNESSYEETVALVDNNILDKQIYVVNEKYWDIKESIIEDNEGTSKLIVAVKKIYHVSTNSETKQIIRCRNRLPNHQDNLILLTLLSIAQNQRSFLVKTTYYDILKRVNWSFGKKNYELVEDSLDVLHSLHITYEKNFYSNGNYINFSTYVISSIYKTNEVIEIQFEPKFIEMMTQNKYFSFLIVNKYARLKSPFQKRLFDILIKSFHNSLSYKIRWENLKKKLEDNSKYKSDFLKKVKRAIKAINDFTYLKIELEDYNGLLQFWCKNEEKIRYVQFIDYLSRDLNKYGINEAILRELELKGYLKKVNDYYILSLRDERLKELIINSKPFLHVLKLFKIVEII